MKRLMLVLAIGTTAALAGCDEPRQEEPAPALTPVEVAPPPVVEAPPPPPVEAAPPVRTDSSALPPDERASEETVKPESETLFY